MSNSTYLILRNRIEQRLAKPRFLIPHMVIFTILTLTLLIDWSTSEGIWGLIESILFLTTIFGNLVVAFHTNYVYTRSGGWKKARDKAIQEEIVAAADEFSLVGAEMIDLHQRLADDIRERSKIFNKLAGIAAGFVFLWQGSLVLSFLLRDVTFSSEFYFSWGLIVPFGTLFLTMTLIPWGKLMPQGNTDEDVRDLYQGKSKRISQVQIDDEGEILPEYEEKYKQNSVKGV